MARPVYITKKLVFDAAERLLNNGIPYIEINNPKIRKELGRGSPNDIQPHLEEWKKQYRLAKGESIEIPDQFRENLSQFGSDLWRLASQTIAEKYNAQFEDYNSIKNQLKETNDLFHNVENELETFRNSLTGICNELSRLRDDVEMNEIRNKIDEIINTYTDRSIKPKTIESEVS